MNAAIRSVVRTAVYHNVEVLGVFHGWSGLINEELKPLNHRSVSGIINQGGTILRTTRCKEFHTEAGKQRAFETVNKHAIDGMVVIGGNGSFAGAHAFFKRYKVRCIGVPASIDNDINGIDFTFGADTAVNTALCAIDNIRDTSTSMERIFVIEVMGRNTGYIALAVALAGGCEDIISPERAYDLEAICQDIERGNAQGKASWIVMIAEGAASAVEIARKITEKTSLETRPVILGHIQRGGRPTAYTRELALRLGHEAVNRLLAGEYDRTVGICDNKIVTVDFELAIQQKTRDVESIFKLIRILT